MADLYLKLVGQPTICRNGSAPAPVPPSLQPFLAFLTLEPATECHRERLIDSLWPDMSGEQGRRRLNTAVWRSRNLLEVAAKDAIVVARSGHITLNETVLTTDIAPSVHALSNERRAAATRGEKTAVDELRRAVLIDAGRFLAGNYDEWVVQTRHQLEFSVVKGVETLLDIASAPEDAIAWAEMLVVLDPLREDAHRRLIRLYADAGRRADALRQYAVCAQHLRDDLGVEPLIETTLVATAIRQGVAPLPTPMPDPQRALRALRDALASCQAAVDSIESAIAALPRD